MLFTKIRKSYNNLIKNLKRHRHNQNMKITEIEIDDSQTGYYWIQIFTKNKREAVSLKHQILGDQAIRERLEAEIKKSQNIVSTTSNTMEMTIQNFLLSKLQSIHHNESDSNDFV